MKKNKIIGQDVFGVRVNYIHYEPVQPSTSLLIFYHGAGETGPSDGSQLDKVESNGPPKHCRNGHEYPFHVIAPQAVSDFEGINKYFLEWLKVRYGFKKILITGLSRGGQATHNLTMKDLTYVDKLYVGAVPVAGRPDAYGSANPATVKDLPMIVVHGDKDNVVPYSQDKDWCERVNATPGRVNKINFITLPGVGHNSWDWAYELNGQNVVFQFMHKMLEEDKVESIENFRQEVIDAIKNL